MLSSLTSFERALFSIIPFISPSVLSTCSSSISTWNFLPPNPPLLTSSTLILYPFRGSFPSSSLSHSNGTPASRRAPTIISPLIPEKQSKYAIISIFSVYKACHITCPEAVVNVYHCYCWCAGVQHPEKGADTAKARTVPDARRNCNNRSGHNTSHNAREGTFHPSADNQDTRRGYTLPVGKESMDTCHSNVIKPINPVPHHRCCNCRLFLNRDGCCPGGYHHEDALSF